MRYIQDMAVAGDLNTNNAVAGNIQRSGLHIDVEQRDDGVHIILNGIAEAALVGVPDELASYGAAIVSIGPVEPVEPT